MGLTILCIANNTNCSASPVVTLLTADEQIA